MSALFNNLPKEVQLSVLSKCDGPTLSHVIRTNRELRDLAVWSARNSLKKLMHRDKVLISVFSPQHEKMCAELFGAHSLKRGAQKVSKSKSQSSTVPTVMLEASSETGSEYGTMYKLDRLTGVRDPLRSDVFEAPVSASADKSIRLFVPEDAPYIQVHFALHIRTQDGRLVKMIQVNTRLRPESQSGTLRFCQGAFQILYRLEGGGELPPRGPYDYEVVKEYFLEVVGFSINDMYLLERAELV